MVSYNFSSCFRDLFQKISFWRIVIVVFSLSMLAGCSSPRPYIVSKSMSEATTSTQKLDIRSIGVLHDRLTTFEYADKCASKHDGCISREPTLMLSNRTVHSLTAYLTGNNGTYTFVVDPKRNRTWFVTPGTYHVEVSIPGFPPTALETLSVIHYKEYKWEFWKDKP